MSHPSWSSEPYKQDIAERFFQGDLSPTSDNFIPCDHCLTFCLLPMAMFFVSPLSVLAVSFGIILIHDPQGLMWGLYQMFQTSIAMGWKFSLVAIVLLILTAVPTIWMWNQGISAFQSVVLGFRERQREHKTGQYRYGLLLTKEYLALRTLDPPYNQEPLILSRHEISKFRTKYTGSGGARSCSLYMDLYQPDGTTYTKRFPDGAIKEGQYKLCSKLNNWL